MERFKKITGNRYVSALMEEVDGGYYIVKQIWTLNEKDITLTKESSILMINYGSAIEYFYDNIIFLDNNKQEI